MGGRRAGQPSRLAFSLTMSSSCLGRFQRPRVPAWTAERFDALVGRRAKDHVGKCRTLFSRQVRAKTETSKQPVFTKVLSKGGSPGNRTLNLRIKSLSPSVLIASEKPLHVLIANRFRR